MNFKPNFNWYEKSGAIIGLIGGLLGVIGGFIGALAGGFAIYDRFDQPELDIIGVAPVAVWTKLKNTDSVVKGISLILRVQNNSKKPTYLYGANINGKIYLSYDNYWPIRRQNEYSGTNEEMKSDFIKLKPYFLISWSGWIPDQKGSLRIEPAEERFVKITFAEPTLMMGVTSVSGHRSDFLGYEKEKNITPKNIVHTPSLEWFFKEVAINNTYRFRGVRDEVRNGLVKIDIQYATKSKSVASEKIMRSKLITKAAWDNYPTRKLYFDE